MADSKEKGYTDPHSMVLNSGSLMDWAINCTSGRAPQVWSAICDMLLSRGEQAARVASIRNLTEQVGTAMLRHYASTTVKTYKDVKESMVAQLRSTKKVAPAPVFTKNSHSETVQVCAWNECKAELWSQIDDGITRSEGTTAVACSMDHYNKAKKQLEAELSELLCSPIQATFNTSSEGRKQVCALQGCNQPVDSPAPCKKSALACSQKHYNRAIEQHAVDEAMEASGVFERLTMWHRWFDEHSPAAEWKPSAASNKMRAATAASFVPGVKKAAWERWTEFAARFSVEEHLNHEHRELAVARATNFLEYRTNICGISAMQAATELWAVDRRHQELGLNSPFMDNDEVRTVVRAALQAEHKSSSPSTRRQELLDHEIKPVEVLEWDILDELAANDDIRVPTRMCIQAMSTAEIAAITTPSQRNIDMRATITAKYQYTKTVQAMIAANIRGPPCAADLSDKLVRKLTVAALYRVFGALTSEKFYPNNKLCEDYAIEQFNRASTSGQFEQWVINTLRDASNKHLLRKCMSGAQICGQVSPAQRQL